ncbi:protein THYLAKOID FORMATION 1, chloroplastic-like isoform X2 [Durio zibethinus]|uniref:Protein THYLAKOID FORMATION 1, chloroplastic-like isoform X2 n=1 Tax=Durio zibethinus TaxID=66656 RepID=A0A6P5YQQ5_DURZI|nr:protein THYLAKOID FORMATION 1, chloroplastic-like isoform X2 [Durio zibethinus]
MAAAGISLSFSAIGQTSNGGKVNVSSARYLASNFEGFRFRISLLCHSVRVGVPSTASPSIIHCMSTANVLQELIVQQHLMRYKRTHRYDAVFALGFVTVYDQLMEGYPSDEDRDAIFQAYINALKEDPQQYRDDAQKLEEWARAQTSSSLVEFPSRDGEIEAMLKDTAERAGGKGNFSYSRFFAVGLFRLLELANATEPTVLEKLCAALNINKRSVDRDLDVYRNMLSKLVQAKELLKEYVDREKKKREERSESQRANEAIKKCLGEY